MQLYRVRLKRHEQKLIFVANKRRRRRDRRNQNFDSSSRSAPARLIETSAEELTPGTSFLPFSRATKHNHSRKRVCKGSGKLERVYSQVNVSDSLSKEEIYSALNYIPFFHKFG